MRWISSSSGGKVGRPVSASHRRHCTIRLALRLTTCARVRTEQESTNGAARRISFRLPLMRCCWPASAGRFLVAAVDPFCWVLTALPPQQPHNSYRCSPQTNRLNCAQLAPRPQPRPYHLAATVSRTPTVQLAPKNNTRPPETANPQN